MALSRSDYSESSSNGSVAQTAYVLGRVMGLLLNDEGTYVELVPSITPCQLMLTVPSINVNPFLVTLTALVPK